MHLTGRQRNGSFYVTPICTLISSLLSLMSCGRQATLPCMTAVLRCRIFYPRRPMGLSLNPHSYLVRCSALFFAVVFPSVLGNSYLGLMSREVGHLLVAPAPPGGCSSEGDQLLGGSHPRLPNYHGCSKSNWHNTQS